MSTRLAIKGIPTGPLEAVCYVLFHLDTKRALIVDPGDHSPAVAKIVSDEGLDVQYIVATHAHMDHIFGAGYFKNLYPKAKVMCNQSDVELWKHAAAFARPFGIRAPSDWSDKPDESFELPNIYNDHLFKLSDNTEDDIGAIASPGHTPGGVMYYNRKAGMILTGDSLFSGGVGRTDFPGGSSEQLEKSIKDTKKFFQNDPNWNNYKIYPGHGSPSNAAWAYKYGENFF